MNKPEHVPYAPIKDSTDLPEGVTDNNQQYIADND